MNGPSTPEQIMEELDQLADHIQQVSARVSSAERQMRRRPSPMDAGAHTSPREDRASSSKTSSTRSSPSGVLSPEGRAQVELQQAKVAAGQEQRTLARIGEFYSEQSKGLDLEKTRSKSMTHHGSHHGSDCDSSNSDQESNASSSVFYGGYNAL